MNHDRIQPHNLEAEMALLGAIMVDDELLTDAAAIVQPADFYGHVHGTIFAAFTALERKGVRIDRISVAEYLGATGQLERCGGVSFLGALMDSVQTASSAEYYARIVLEKSQLRQIISTGDRMVEAAYGGEAEGPEPIVNAYAPKIQQIAERGPHLDGVSTSDIAESILGSPLRIIPTPFPRLNEFIGGLAEGELVIVSSSNQHGKSGFVLSFADHTAYHGGRVLYYPLEMDTRDTMWRHVAMRSGISARQRRLEQMTDSEWDAWTRWERELGNWPITYFPAFPELSVADIRARARRAARSEQISLIIVDHVREITDFTNCNPSHTHQTMYRVYRELRQLARELRCPMLAVAHQKRDGRDTGNKEPSISEIKDGGNAEDIASTILLPWRPKFDGKPDEQRVGKLKIGKSRSGVTASIPMEYIGRRTLWYEEKMGRPWFEPAPPEQTDLLEAYA